jgi:hypothetical protein
VPDCYEALLESHVSTLGEEVRGGGGQDCGQHSGERIKPWKTAEQNVMDQAIDKLMKEIDGVGNAANGG